MRFAPLLRVSFWPLVCRLAPATSVIVSDTCNLLGDARQLRDLVELNRSSVILGRPTVPFCTAVRVSKSDEKPMRLESADKPDRVRLTSVNEAPFTSGPRRQRVGARANAARFLPHRDHLTRTRRQSAIGR